MPVAIDSLRPDLIVADVVFNPPQTWLIRTAADRGCRTIDGLGMLVNQAVISFEIWTGRKPDANVMRDALEESVWLDVTSVMDFGIVLGAFLAAGLAGRFRPSWRLSRADLLTAIAGGLLLGYGARLAFGCNVGAFFSGVASGSLHGWLWLICAFTGNWVGTRLRPACGLSRI